MVFGYSGQVAQELRRRVPSATFLDRRAADLSNPAACAQLVHQIRPSVVINAAAYTAVDNAEKEEEQAMIINGVAPGMIAEACAEQQIPLVHISTDYVFEGSGNHAWTPDHPVGPRNAYGRTKLAGEVAVQRAGGPYAILRTSWVFSAHGSNFVKTMIHLSKSRDTVAVVADQIGGPTPADAIAKACLVIANALVSSPEKSGIYHLSGEPATTWECFARETFARVGKRMKVTGISTSEYPTPAARPLNSRMDTTSLTAAFGIAPADWRAGLDRVIKELGAMA